MNCPYCKKPIEVNMTFCPHCMSVLKDADVEEFLKVDEIDSVNDPKDVSIKEFISNVDDEQSQPHYEEEVEQVDDIQEVEPEEQFQQQISPEIEIYNNSQVYNNENSQSPIWPALWAILSVLVIGVFVFGYMIYQRFSSPIESFGLLRPHQEVDAFESDMSAKTAALKVNEGEFSLEQYLKEGHTQKNKNRLFKIFYDNVLYYSDVMTHEQSEQECNITIDERPGIQTFICNGLKMNFNIKVEYDAGYDGTPYHYSVINGIKIVSPEVKSIYATGDGEGGYLFLPDYIYIESTYSRYLSSDWQDFLRINAGMQDDLKNQPLFSDGYLTIELKTLADWIIQLDSFRKKYPKFELAEKIQETIHSYTSDLLLTEYRTFDTATEIMLPKAKLAYEYFIEKSDKKSEEYKIVKSCYEALKAHNFKYNSEFRQEFEKWNK